MGLFVVAGVTGRVGAVVADTLLSRGHAPRVVVRSEERGARWRSRGAEVVTGSLADASFLARALQEASGFFTLLPEDVPPEDFHGARRRMADAIVEAVRASAVPHVVMLSAIPAVLPDGNGPAKDLHYLENRLLVSGATVSVLRACYFQDNVAAVLPAAKQGGVYPSFMTSAEAAFPTISTRDVGRFAAEALLDPPRASEIVDLLGPAYSIRQLARELGGALGAELRVVEIPPEGHVAALAGAGVPRPIAEALAEMFAAVNAGAIAPRGHRRRLGTTTLGETLAAFRP
jgi:uncharacterized protein YbjT (DUF2867 family)